MATLAQATGGGFDVLQSLQSAFTAFVNYLPQLLGAVVVLLIGYLIAKILDKLITKGLQKARLDERLTSNSGGRYVEKVSPGGSPARLVGGVVFWVIMLFVVSAAIATLNIPALTAFFALVLSYLPRVIAALLIFIVAAALAGAVGGLAQRTMGDTPTGRLVRAGAPILIMAIAVFMILTQLGIAPVIVTATYIALIGGLALAAALAFGLGGRDAARDMIDSGYRKAREHSGTVAEDLHTARERGMQDSQAAREYAEQQTTEPGRSTEHGVHATGGGTAAHPQAGGTYETDRPGHRAP
jgi:small-conductance mechanosensitive channel